MAGQLSDGALLQGDGTLTMPDGTVQRPGVERVLHGEITAGTTISHGASKAAIVVIDCTETGGNVVMTALPNVEAGTHDGQILILRMLSTAGFTLTLRDESVVAGSGMRMVADNQLVGGARDSHAFTWNATEGKWYAGLGGRVNNL